MASVPERRKVLVLNDEPCIRRLFILAKRLGSEDSPDGNGASPLAEINRRHFERVIVDLRYPPQQRKAEVHGIGEIRPSLMGRTLVVNVDVKGPKTLGLVERYLTNRLPPSLLWLICHR